MKKLGIVASVALLVVLVSSTCFAGVNAGQTQVNLSGSISSTKPDTGDKTTSTMVTTGLGYFLQDNISLGGALFVDYSKTGSTKTLIDVINGQAKFHFAPKEILVPYVGIQLGYMGVDMNGSSGSGYDYGAMAGIDYFITENASLNVELNYRKDVFKMSSVEYKQDTTALLFGLSYFFGK